MYVISIGPMGPNSVTATKQSRLRQASWEGSLRLGSGKEPGSNRSRFLGRGCDEALFSKKEDFSLKREAFSEFEGFGKDFFNRKGTSVKRSGQFSEPPDSEN